MPTDWAYFDTSVLVKRYIRESGSRQASTLLKKYRVVTSALAPLEATSAFGRRWKQGDLSEPLFHAILSRLRQDCAYWQFLEVSVPVLHCAEEVIAKTGLRTLDAIHLASALSFHSHTALPIRFLTADALQREAAKELALEVGWVA